MQFVEFVLALVDAATFHKVITIRRTAALEVSFFHKLPQAGTGTDRSFFAFAVCLPEADIVQQFVSVVVESLERPHGRAPLSVRGGQLQRNER